MKAGIITIGDELLIGQTINTNLAWMGKELENIGISIIQSTTIQDREDAITNALDYFLKQYDLVIVTGGLGPTNDDITKETLSKYFKRKLIMYPDVLENIQTLFSKKGKKLTSLNIDQALLPEDITVLINLLGSASGMWFEEKQKIAISLPGVPYEMKHLIRDEVIPRLQSKFKLKSKYYQTLMIQGIGESSFAELIKDWEDRITKDGLHLAYLPSPGILKLRLNVTTNNQDQYKIKTYFDELKKRFPQYVYGENEASIFQVVSTLLKNKNAQLGTVESCTGGGIANSFVQFPGSSLFLKGGLVTYSNELKIKLAKVNPDTLKNNGAVSEAVVKEMALGGQKEMAVDYTIAVSGIAGPDGGTKEKPVGTTWIAVASPERVVAKHFLLGDHRGRNIEKAKMYAANLLRKEILNITDE